MQSISRTPSIYQIRHIASGKVYVGSAINPRKRKNDHWQYLRKGTHINRYLQNAWNKYGETAFVFEILEPVLFVEDLITREQYWIDRLLVNDKQHGFNITPTAGSLLGMKQTDEQRAKRSALYTDPAFSEKYAAGQKARFVNPEERTKRSEQAKALWNDPLYRKRMTDRHRESHANPEYRARVSEKSKAQFADPNQREVLSKRSKARWDNPEWRARQMETRAERAKNGTYGKKKAGS